MAYRALLKPLRPGTRVASLWGTRALSEHRFKPEKVAVVTKTTRYEFELQRYRYAGLSEDDLKQLLAMKGSSYSGLLERHNVHTDHVEHIVDSLQREGMQVRVLRRREYDEEAVRWADAIVSAGGDGTMLLAASKVFDKDKPVLGVNTDPERSEGHLCLPVSYTHAFPEALRKLRKGEFRWQWRHRLRLHLEGTGINPTPVDLHEQQLSLDEHNLAHRISTEDGAVSCPHLLPVRGLNEVFIGESLSSRASYYEISIDDGPWEKQKSSGLSICTGTGSKAWYVACLQHRVLREGGLTLRCGRDLQSVCQVTKEYNESLMFGPEENRLFFSIREPIVNRVYSTSRQRGFASRVCVRSRCWDACMVVDGGTSFEFNDGAIATISLNEEDQLRTILLKD
uniref:NAD kinase 2, mitochondrial n=1 Tax=Paramormyrops kingsleyae TaxID=1676925 RepID=A0A3B3Q4T0_9TELE